ncbi:MAG TPA: DUF899 family protein [Caulobacteraceae bacterium]|jgi:predicted dithiol-disulfide oxidoreductase (DUF899 family)
MTYSDTIAVLKAKRQEIEALRVQMRELQATIEPEVVADYDFTGWDGPTTLSQLFGDKRDLFVIHNMGTRCNYCTMWADGFNGVYDHLANRAAFVVASPDETAVQRQFAGSRGWRFPMVTPASSDFTKDMGFWSPKAADHPLGDMTWPGVSVFQKRGEAIVRVSDAELGEYDDFCSVWHFLDLLPERSAGWEPQARYN